MLYCEWYKEFQNSYFLYIYINIKKTYSFSALIKHQIRSREERGEGDDVDICATTPIMNFRRSLKGNRSKSTLFFLLANTFIEVTEYLGKY